MFVNREEFIQELILRERIRSIAEPHLRRKQKRSANILEEETKLRRVINRLISEAAEEMAPHRNTGINVLADLLKKIVPQIEQEYKMLTTDTQQRESFRAHVINATQNALSTASQSFEEPGELEMELPELEEAEISLDISADAEDKFIDIDEEPPTEAEEEEDTFGLEGEDETGRNFAQRAFEKVEKQIVEAYGLLSNEEDKQLFQDYLITNLKLYFDRFEDELASTTEEPTTDEYEAEVEAEELGGEEELGLGGEEPELGAGELEL